MRPPKFHWGAYRISISQRQKVFVSRDEVVSTRRLESGQQSVQHRLILVVAQVRVQPGPWGDQFCLDGQNIYQIAHLGHRQPMAVRQTRQYPAQFIEDIVW